MSLTDRLSLGPQQRQSEQLAMTEANLQLLHPRPNEGVFLPGPDVEEITYRFTGEGTEASPKRRHDLLRVTLDKCVHVIWLTEPVEPRAEPLNVLPQPGLGETIEDGIGAEFHMAMARYLPKARIISNATHGIGYYGQELSLPELITHGVNQMGRQNLAFWQKYLGTQPVAMVGNSMGTVINNRLLNLNMDSDDPLNVKGVINLAPALVPPENIVKDMILRFPLEMLIDGVTEATLRTRICHFMGLMATMGHSKIRGGDAKVLIREMLSLVPGTPREDIERPIPKYRTATIVGAKCGVGQVPMWREIQEDYDDFILHALPGRRHGIALKPIDSARKTSKTIQQLDLIAA